jgi:hypothetical protein
MALPLLSRKPNVLQGHDYSDQLAKDNVDWRKIENAL